MGSVEWWAWSGHGLGIDLAASTAPSLSSMPFLARVYPKIAANAAHVLVGVACALLDRQIESLARSFERQGDFTERLYRVRSRRRMG